MIQSPLLYFDHIGILTDDLDGASAHFANLIGAVGITRRFDDPELTVAVQFLQDGAGIIYELITPLGTRSIVAGPLKKKRDLLNQLAYRTKHVEQAAQHLRQMGCFPLGAAKPAIAFSGAPVQFFMSPLGFIIEIIDTSSYQHEFIKIGVENDE
ncbi:MAG: VOC family protein [bacterium]